MSSVALRLKTRTQEVEAFSEVHKQRFHSSPQRRRIYGIFLFCRLCSSRPRSTRRACGRCRRRSCWRPSTRPGSPTSTARRSGCGCRSSESCRSVLGHVSRVSVSPQIFFFAVRSEARPSTGSVFVREHTGADEVQSRAEGNREVQTRSSSHIFTRCTR